jgi:uncharacterized protein (TIGR02246 family)
MTLTNDDKVEIRELVSRYNKAIDTGDPDAWTATFTDDGEFDGVVGIFTGATELRAFAAAYTTEEQYAPFAVAQHWVTNLVVDGGGDIATAFSNLMMVKPGADAGSIGMVGHYEDSLRRVDGQWRFAKRIVRAD